MKLLLILVLVCQFAKAQTTLTLPAFTGSILSDWEDCGTWKAKPIYYTEWEPVDTLSKKRIADTLRNWVYDEERMFGQYSMTLTAEYAPCGKGTGTRWEQKRICSITGIIQKRNKVQSYEYIPKPKTEYKKVIESFSK